MNMRFLAGLVAAVVVCGSAFAGQYYGNGRGYSAAPARGGYDTYARQPNAYECVSVNQAFVSVMHRSVRLKKRQGDDARTKYTPTSVAVGYVHTMGKLQLGAAFNYEGGTRKLNYPNGDGFKTKNSIPGISAFATYRPFMDSTYVSGSAFLGFATYKGKDAYGADEGAIGGTDKEHRNLYSLGLEAGHTWAFGCGVLVTPHVGLDLSYAPTEKYQFANNNDARIKSQSYWEFPLGVTVKKTFDVGGWLLTPKVDATILPTLGRIDPKNEHPGFSYRVADRWKVVGASGSNFGARVTLGVDARFSDRFNVGVDYTYEGRSRYDDHRIAANLGLSF